jgi:hypothetical protein
MTDFESVGILIAALPRATAFDGRRIAAGGRGTTAGSKREYSGRIAQEMREHG